MGEVDESQSVSHCVLGGTIFKFSKNPCFPDKARVLLLLLWLGSIPYHSVIRLPNNIILVGGVSGGRAHRLILHQGAINIVMPALPLCLVFMV